MTMGTSVLECALTEVNVRKCRGVLRLEFGVRRLGHRKAFIYSQ